MSPQPVRFPSGYATAVAIGTVDPEGNIALIDPANPLPVRFDGTIETGGSGSSVTPAPPLGGTLGASGLVGPYAAARGLPIIVELAGTWTGEVRLQRSTDGGATRHNLTVGGSAWAVFTGNALEPVWTESEANVAFYLAVTLSSGTLAYRISQ